MAQLVVVSMLQLQNVFKPNVCLTCRQPDLSPTFHYVTCITFNKHDWFRVRAYLFWHIADIWQDINIKKRLCVFHADCGVFSDKSFAAAAQTAAAAACCCHHCPPLPLQLPWFLTGSVAPMLLLCCYRCCCCHCCTRAATSASSSLLTLLWFCCCHCHYH